MNDLNEAVITLSATISFLERELEKAEEEARKIADRYGPEAADGYRQLFSGVEEHLTWLKEARRQLLQ